MNTICIIGKRGIVSQLLQEKLQADPSIHLRVISTDEALDNKDDGVFASSDLVILCTQEFQSEMVMKVLSPDKRVIDISPTYRCSADWIYGLPEIMDRDTIKQSRRVANPGCFATSAILLFAPLLQHKLIQSHMDFYLDGTGGYTTGGAKLIDAFTLSALEVETAYGLKHEHRHVAEIKHQLKMTGNLCFTPKIVGFATGIRMQTFIPNESRDVLLSAYNAYYEESDIIVSDECESKLCANDWADKPGACIRVYTSGTGCLVVCVMDNLGKGAVDSAISNAKLMLS